MRSQTAPRARARSHAPRDGARMPRRGSSEAQYECSRWSDRCSPAVDLNRYYPVSSEIERQLLIEPVDERRTVFVQKRHKPDRTLLHVAAGKGECAGVHELASKCFVPPLGGGNHLAVQCLQVVLHPAQG